MGTIIIQKDQLVNFIENRRVFKINAYNSTTIGQKDEFVERFWYYKKFAGYIKVIAIIIVIMSLLTWFLGDSEVFIGILGTWSSVIEAMLGVP